MQLVIARNGKGWIEYVRSKYSRLGAYLGISSNQVSRIETGKAKCSLEHLLVIAQTLNCSSDYLLFGKKQMPILFQEQVDMIEQLYQSITISRQ